MPISLRTHVFLPSPTNSDKCIICSYNKISHTKQATCDSCDYVGEVEIDLLNKMVLCPSCMDSSVKAEANDSQRNLELITHNGAQHNPEKATFIDDTRFASLVESPLDNALSQVEDSPLNDLLEESRIKDKAVNGITFYNAQIISNKALIDAINADSSIPSDKKISKISEVLFERFVTLQESIFARNQETYKETQAAIAIRDDLRKYGNEVRAEIRERIKNNDITYQPAQKVVKPVVKREPKKTAKDRIIEQIMLSKKLNKVDAEKLYEKMALED